MNIAQNKKALFEYEILKTFEAGLVLTGQETKSARSGNMNLKGTYVSFYKGEPYLMNANISKYSKIGPLPDYDPQRKRKLLLNKKEIQYLIGKTQEKGLTIVPIKVYTNNRFIKAEIGIVRGKKKHDKRESIKKRDQEREMQRMMKN